MAATTSIKCSRCQIPPHHSSNLIKFNEWQQCTGRKILTNKNRFARTKSFHCGISWRKASNASTAEKSQSPIPIQNPAAMQPQPIPNSPQSMVPLLNVDLWGGGVAMLCVCTATQSVLYEWVMTVPQQNSATLPAV